MKKLLIPLLIAAIALCFAACGKKSEPTATEQPTAQPSTQRHTVPPTEQTPKLEWAPVDCDIALHSSDGIAVEAADFLTFALDGSTDKDCKLRFSLSETAAGVLAAQQTDPFNLYLTVNGDPLKGKLSFSDDYTELVMQGNYSYDEMCRLATTIRGL